MPRPGPPVTKTTWPLAGQRVLQLVLQPGQLLLAGDKEWGRRLLCRIDQEGRELRDRFRCLRWYWHQARLVELAIADLLVEARRFRLGFHIQLVSQNLAAGFILRQGGGTLAVQGQQMDE